MGVGHPLLAPPSNLTDFQISDGQKFFLGPLLNLPCLILDVEVCPGDNADYPEKKNDDERPWKFLRFQ
jgi:hypothetical protein